MGAEENLPLVKMLNEVLMMLSNAVMPAMAAKNEKECGCGACEITLKRMVEVDIAKNGEPILNIAETNKSLNEWFSENFKFSCADGSCLTYDHNIEVYEVLNTSAKSKELKFLEVRIFNDTKSYEFKLLSYFIETATYNLSLMTRIVEIDDENYFITTINVAPKDDKKFAPFADIIEIKSKTTLAEHYRILAKVLNVIRMGDETIWIWNKAKNELNYLGRVVERELSEYNLEGFGTAIVIDSTCTEYCNFICGIALGSLCILASGGLGAVICAIGSGFGCCFVCSDICGEYPHYGSMSCSTACAVFVSAFCKYKAQSSV